MSLGKVHEDLGVTLGLGLKGEVKVRMDDYVENFINNFPHKLKSTYINITLAGNNLFDNGNCTLLGKSKYEYFHMMVAKALFLSKR